MSTERASFAFLSMACPHCHCYVRVPLRHARRDDGPCEHGVCHGRTHIRLHYAGLCSACEREIIASFKV